MGSQDLNPCRHRVRSDQQCWNKDFQSLELLSHFFHCRAKALFENIHRVYALIDRLLNELSYLVLIPVLNSFSQLLKDVAHYPPPKGSNHFF